MTPLAWLLAAVSIPGAVAEADRRSANPLWPGFDPRTIPLAVYDGRRTWLFRHPQPPSGFVREGTGWTLPGRHPAITANNAVELGGVLTAGVLLDRETKVDERALAGTLIHEAFHAFQARRHPDWFANEGALFEYPSTDGSLLALRRLESMALAHALTEGPKGARWARAALALRRERFARMTKGAVEYERQNELKEGLAQYIQDRAIERPADLRWPEDEFAPDEIRQRGYASGQALAVLLDRFDPGWKDAVDALGGPLDQRLETALGRGPVAGFGDQRATVTEKARRDAAVLLLSHESRRKELLEAPGARIEVVAAPGAPLFPQGFDPMNVIALPDGTVLHTRFLKLGNEAGSIEVLGWAALTEAAGRHPLFEGVKRLVVTGLPARPAVEERDGIVTLRADSVQAEFRGARVVREPTGLRLELAAPQPKVR
jgi:hypothetical protein